MKFLWCLELGVWNFRAWLKTNSAFAIALRLLLSCARLSKVCSAAVNGIDAYPVEVEVNCGYGDTLIVVMGLPDAAVKESKDRVSTAWPIPAINFRWAKPPSISPPPM